MIIMSHELKLKSDCRKEREIRSAVHEFIMQGEVAIDEAGPLIKRELDKIGVGVPQILNSFVSNQQTSREEAGSDRIAVDASTNYNRDEI